MDKEQTQHTLASIAYGSYLGIMLSVLQGIHAALLVLRDDPELARLIGADVAKMAADGKAFTQQTIEALDTGAKNLGVEDVRLANLDLQSRPN